MTEGVEHISTHQIASGQRTRRRAPVARFSARLLLVVLLLGSGGALADHAVDHRASSAAPESGFNPLNILQQLTGNSVSEFLDPEVAYVLSAEARDANTLVARFDIADDYYLYRDKFNFAVTSASGVVLGSTQLPDGKVNGHVMANTKLLAEAVMDRRCPVPERTFVPLIDHLLTLPYRNVIDRRALLSMKARLVETPAR